MVPYQWIRTEVMSPAARIAVIAALPREIAPLISGWRRIAPPKGENKISLAISEDAVVACAGMGRGRVTLALEAAQSLGPVSAIVSVGFAGALTAATPVGHLYRPSTVIDVRTGERFACATGDGSVAVTAPQIASAVEKTRLSAAYSAQLVEMEAATLGRLASIRQLPFFCFKAISDDASFSLPILNNFATADGQFRTAAFAAHILLRPRLWSPARELGRGAKLAQQSLVAGLRQWLAEQSAQHLSY
jgi:adenosylhomocysteine nucleosidase